MNALCSELLNNQEGGSGFQRAPVCPQAGTQASPVLLLYLRCCTAPRAVPVTARGGGGHSRSKCAAADHSLGRGFRAETPAASCLASNITI